MCAISGIFSEKIDENKIALVKKFNNIQKHRGPDNSGIFKTQNIIFGHNRLSILDLSKNGNQPMVSKSGRFIITYNGEIYNHLKLRDEFLNDHRFQGNSDTETLIELIEKKGLSLSLKLIEGMFAFGLWDQKEKTLSLIRDRFGEKPLYYSFYNNSVIFSSELKSFEIFKKDLKINLQSVKEYLSLSYIPSPKTIYENIFKLEPGSFINLNLSLFDKNSSHGFVDFKKQKKIKVENYWSPFFKNPPLNIKNNFQDYKKIINNKIENSVKDKMISDVPIGVFLSGGIDSSLVAAIMKKYSETKINTFTVASENSNFDESERAKEISKHLGANHHLIEVSKKQQLEVINDINNIYDEPFSDSSQIPTIILSKFTKDYVKVVLTGDGADEIFYGYNRYIFAEKIWKKINFLPKSIRKSISQLIYNISPKNWISLQKFLSNSLSSKFDIALFDEKIYKIADSLANSNNLYESYLSFLRIWQKNEKIFKAHNEKILLDDLSSQINLENENYKDSLNLLDIKSYLPDDILVKTDRATMTYGLEARAPYLTSQLLDITKQMPINFRTLDNNGKIILRDILSDYLPKKLIDGPKKGFSIPMNDWLNTSLKEWAEDLFNSDSYRKCSYLNQKLIDAYWKKHKNNSVNYHKRIWNVLILIDWMNKKGFSI